MPEIDTILQHAEKRDASDIHIKTGLRPRLRVAGEIEEIAELPPLTASDIQRITAEMMTPAQRDQSWSNIDLDFAYGDGNRRFRCACFRDHQGPGAVYRRIPAQPSTLEELNLPNVLTKFAHMTRGLVLVTGASGSGKTSTLASLIGIINECFHKHIITLEDPIEYIHEDRLGVIHQRGLYDDFADFETAIIDAMRQDPDVLVIGELRSIGSIRRALTAAETGTLVLATLHTNSASDTIDRLIDSFPVEEQSQVRVQLSESLAGVVSQALLNRAGKPGRVPATEILVNNSAVGNIIREGKTQELINVIQSGRSRGMHTMDDALMELVRNGVVTSREAAAYAHNKGRFEDSPYGRVR